MNKEKALIEIIESFGNDTQKALLQEVITAEKEIKQDLEAKQSQTNLSYSDKFVKRNEILSIKDHTERLKAIEENLEVFQ
ncbi:Uncharacterised protein [Streptococcus pyogenes]|uniref:hypothetical protein n=1 Tax=Streptococcus pyogenes TaxID=1314 RepID=UPI0010A187C4|nr:hypothetical protein [Streptococcus pyogenes]VGQ21954.1 Uncharacterised protein [Streptococcus pyogenes]